MLTNVLTQLGINSTLWIQLAIFIALYLFLRVIYFQPFLKLIQDREKASVGSEKETQELLKKIESDEFGYNQKLSELKKAAKESSDKIIAESKQKAAEKIAAARQKNKEKLEHNRSEINKDFEQSLKSADAQVTSISELMMEKIVDTKVGL